MSKIILYTSDTCIRCHNVKTMLDIHSVKYTEVSDKQLIISMDLESVPAIKVDDKIIDNYPLVLSWLEDNGYYSFEVNEDEGN